MKQLPITLLLLTISFFLNPLYASELLGNISDTNYSAKLLNESNIFSSATSSLPYIYFNTPLPYSVKISDTELTGYLWGPLVGYISLNCSNTSSCGSSDFKVKNNNGVLSGYAWGENAGWISFNCANTETANCAQNNNAHLSINSQGEFSGFAWTQNFGWIKFDCVSRETCVKTDWKKPSERQISSLPPSGSGGNSAPLAKEQKIETTQTKDPKTPEEVIDFLCKGASCVAVSPIETTSSPKTKAETITDNKNNTNQIYKSPLFFKGNGASIGEMIVEILTNKAGIPLTITIFKDVELSRVYGFEDSSRSSSFEEKKLSLLEQGIIYRIDKQSTIEGEKLLSGVTIKITLPIPTIFKETDNLYIYGKSDEEATWKLIKTSKYVSQVSFETNKYNYFKVASHQDSKFSLSSPKNFIFFSCTLFLLAILAIHYYTKKHVNIK